jgi:voltage-gated sodium channel
LRFLQPIWSEVKQLLSFFRLCWKNMECYWTVSAVPALRRVVSGLLTAIPGLTSVAAIMLLIFYVGTVIATKIFGQHFPEWFGSIWHSAYSLFQVMTLESWSMGIVRPMMEKFPYAWMFFLPFILIATFTMLNLFIAVIVNAMQAETEKAAEERATQGHDERLQMLQEMREMKELLQSLRGRSLQVKRDAGSDQHTVNTGV